MYVNPLLSHTVGKYQIIINSKVETGWKIIPEVFPKLRVWVGGEMDRDTQGTKYTQTEVYLEYNIYTEKSYSGT